MEQVHEGKAQVAAEECAPAVAVAVIAGAMRQAPAGNVSARTVGKK